MTTRTGEKDVAASCDAIQHQLLLCRHPRAGLGDRGSCGCGAHALIRRLTWKGKAATAARSKTA